jgi:hypothetical protein
MQPDEYEVLHMGVHALALLQAQAQCEIFDGEILQFSTEGAFFDYILYGHCVILYIEDLDGLAANVADMSGTCQRHATLSLDFADMGLSQRTKINLPYLSYT